MLQQLFPKVGFFGRIISRIKKTRANIGTKINLHLHYSLSKFFLPVLQCQQKRSKVNSPNNLKQKPKILLHLVICSNLHLSVLFDNSPLRIPNRETVTNFWNQKISNFSLFTFSFLKFSLKKNSPKKCL